MLGEEMTDVQVFNGKGSIFFPESGTELGLDSGWDCTGEHTDGLDVAEQGLPRLGTFQCPMGQSMSRALPARR